MKYFVFVSVFSLFLLFDGSTFATTEYARQTGFQCSECNVEAIGGGTLTVRGQEFLSDMKTKGLYRPLTKTQRIIRFIIGYIHLLTAIAWYGLVSFNSYILYRS